MLNTVTILERFENMLDTGEGRERYQKQADGSWLVCCVVAHCGSWLVRIEAKNEYEWQAEVLLASDY